jgi:hypothetical protein
MTWIGRNKGWIRRAGPNPTPCEPIKPPETQSIGVPNLPILSPSAIAAMVGHPRQTVLYWISTGKLAAIRDNIGDFYVEKHEIRRFITQYLQRDTHELSK